MSNEKKSAQSTEPFVSQVANLDKSGYGVMVFDPAEEIRKDSEKSAEKNKSAMSRKREGKNKKTNPVKEPTTQTGSELIRIPRKVFSMLKTYQALYYGETGVKLSLGAIILEAVSERYENILKDFKKDLP